MSVAVVIDQPYGQLGNTLFRLGNVIGYCQSVGASFWDRSLYASGYIDHFPCFRDALLLRVPGLRGACLSPRLGHKVQSRILSCLHFFSGVDVIENYGGPFFLRDLKFKNSVKILRGFHFFDHGGVRENSDLIRRWFKLDPAVEFELDSVYSSMSRKSEFVIGVHVRQGDWREWSSGKYFIEVEQYYRVVADLTAQFRERCIQFIFFSDGEIPDDLMSSAPLGAPSPFRESAIKDMYFLSRCDLVVSSCRSTFSGWAAFHGAKPIMRLMPGEDTPSVAGLSPVSFLDSLA